MCGLFAATGVMTPPSHATVLFNHEPDLSSLVLESETGERVLDYP